MTGRRPLLVDAIEHMLSGALSTQVLYSPASAVSTVTRWHPPTPEVAALGDGSRAW
ncbi:MAG: hypothetical protein WCC38_14140 [Pseudonocardiaceae bacterium]